MFLQGGSIENEPRTSWNYEFMYDESFQEYADVLHSLTSGDTVSFTLIGKK